MLRFTTPDRRRFLAGTAAGASAAASPRAVRAPDRPEVLHVRSHADLAVLDPAYRRTASDHDVFRCLLPALISYKTSTDRWEWELEAADEVRQLDDTTIAFRLKPGWRWSGGFGELTAEDVKYSYERIADPANKSPYHDDWSALDHVEVTGPYTGTIKLKQFFAPLWSTTLPVGSGRIVCKKAVEALPDKRFTTSVPASCGPYTLAEWQPKRRTVLRRDPDYEGPQPHFDEVHVYPIDDEEAAEVAYQGGVLDFTSIGLHSFAGDKGQAPAGSVLVDKPSLALNWVGMNVEHPKLRDERVRKAIRPAIDAEAAVDAAYFGRAARATGVVAPGLVGYRDRNLAGHDPAEAKRLLTEAGVKSLGLTMHLLNKTGHLAMARAVQASLAEVGIALELVPLDSDSFWTLGDERSGDRWKTVQLVLRRFTLNPDPAWATVWFTPGQIGVWNWERWDSPEFGRLHEQGLHERDPKARDELYRRMQDLMEESGAYLFLTHGVIAYIPRADLEPALWPDGRLVFREFRDRPTVPDRMSPRSLLGLVLPHR